MTHHDDQKLTVSSLIAKLKNLAAIASALVSGLAMIACNLSSTNGIDGTTSLIQTTTEEKSSHCQYGGVRIETGADVNFDGVLSEFEVTSIQYICNGSTGTPGIQGESGVTSLTQTSVVPSGVSLNNGGCEAGGIRIDTGKDTNGNGILDEFEIKSTNYICNGIQGTSGLTSLVSLASISEGENCPAGGIQLNTGLDANSNNILDDHEIQSTQYLCNGQQGISGFNALVVTSDEEKGEKCSNGGVQIDSGIDLNSDGVLADNEIISTKYICNGIQGKPGEDGINALTKTTIEPSGNNCASGGVRLDFGSDSNKNNQLDTNEINQTKYICNGTDGVDGADAQCANVTIPEVTVSPGDGEGRIVNNTYYLTITSTKSGMTHNIIGAAAKFTLHQAEQEQNGKYVTIWKYTSTIKTNWTTFAVISKDECSTIFNSFGLTFIQEDLPLITIPARAASGSIEAVPSFNIMKYPIPVSLVSKCLASGTCPLNNNMYDTAIANRCNINSNAHSSYQGDYIFNCVTYEGAEAICTWLGGRLPTCDEWLTAARHNGTTYVANQTYPWGNNYPEHCFHANYMEYELGGNDKFCNHATETYYMQSPGYIFGYPPGQSALGVATMVGDAGEWIQRTIDPRLVRPTEFMQYMRKAQLCGGSFDQEPDSLELDNTCSLVLKTQMGSNTSIRCAFDLS